MEANKNNFQFQHDFSKESYELIKILFPKALEKGFAYGMIDGKKFMNTHAFHPHIPIVTPSEALALLQPTSSEKWEPEGSEWEQDVKNAVAVLTQALQNDPAFYYSYQANIAVAFQDEMHRNGLTNEDNSSMIHEISNTAARNFLNLLIRPVKTLRDEIVSEIFDWVYKNEKPLDLADRILALIEQRRGGK